MHSDTQQIYSLSTYITSKSYRWESNKNCVMRHMLVDKSLNSEMAKWVL